jgi:hypothetical protein
LEAIKAKADFCTVFRSPTDKAERKRLAVCSCAAVLRFGGASFIVCDVCRDKNKGRANRQRVWCLVTPHRNAAGGTQCIVRQAVPPCCVAAAWVACGSAQL